MNDFIAFWQHLPASIDPVLISVGPFELRYYGLMYLAAFLCTYLLVLYRIRTEGYDLAKETIQDYFVWAILGLLVGARLGYVLFYDVSSFLAHPLGVFLPFDVSNGFRFSGISGLSYHGGALGVLGATVLFCRRRNIGLLRFMDLIVSCAPLGYTFGRIGNFINGELYGRSTSLPWGMYFPLDEAGLLRHPSQLYEAFFEGIVLFAVLWLIRKKDLREGTLLALYAGGYGAVRFGIEFVRQPDHHMGLFFGLLTMGQLLCLAMVIGSLLFFFIRRHREHYHRP